MTVNTIHNALSLMKIGKSFIRFRSTHWRHKSTFFLSNSINIISKNPWVIYLCVSQIHPPCVMPTYATQINDPRTSVDMVLPVYRLNSGIRNRHNFFVRPIFSFLKIKTELVNRPDSGDNNILRISREIDFEIFE